MMADEFKDMRWQLRLKQIELAEVLGVHPVTVNKWEKGAREIPRIAALAMRGLLCEQERRHTSQGGQSQEGAG
jgi:DNA-binding transcriptional regulator YiaG